MILRLEMILSLVSLQKNIVSYENNPKHTKNNTFNNVFCNRIFPYYRFLPIVKKLLDFHQSWLIFSGIIFSKTLMFSILKLKFSVDEIVK